MNIKMERTIRQFLYGIVFMLCLVFSCGLIVPKDGVSANGGIYVEDGANVQVNGGLLQNNDKAIVFEGGEHVLENVTISGSTNGAIHLAGGGNPNC